MKFYIIVFYRNLKSLIYLNVVSIECEITEEKHNFCKDVEVSKRDLCGNGFVGGFQDEP